MRVLDPVRQRRHAAVDPVHRVLGQGEDAEEQQRHDRRRAPASPRRGCVTTASIRSLGLGPGGPRRSTDLGGEAADGVVARLDERARPSRCLRASQRSLPAARGSPRCARSAGSSRPRARQSWSVSRSSASARAISGAWRRFRRSEACSSATAGAIAAGTSQAWRDSGRSGRLIASFSSIRPLPLTASQGITGMPSSCSSRATRTREPGRHRQVHHVQHQDDRAGPGPAPGGRGRGFARDWSRRRCRGSGPAAAVSARRPSSTSRVTASSGERAASE